MRSLEQLDVSGNRMDEDHVPEALQEQLLKCPTCKLGNPTSPATLSPIIIDYRGKELPNESDNGSGEEFDEGNYDEDGDYGQDYDADDDEEGDSDDDDEEDDSDDTGDKEDEDDDNHKPDLDEDDTEEDDEDDDDEDDYHDYEFYDYQGLEDEDEAVDLPVYLTETDSSPRKEGGQLDITGSLYIGLAVIVPLLVVVVVVLAWLLYRRQRILALQRTSGKGSSNADTHSEDGTASSRHWLAGNMIGTCLQKKKYCPQDVPSGVVTLQPPPGKLNQEVNGYYSNLLRQLSGTDLSSPREPKSSTGSICSSLPALPVHCNDFGANRVVTSSVFDRDIRLTASFSSDGERSRPAGI